MKQFEVWLDESGRFDDTPYVEDLYSFIGDVLIAKKDITKIPFSKLLKDKKLNHAMELSSKEKKSLVLPILKDFKQASQSQFLFFENIEYKGIGDNRALYLEIFAEGVLQLLQYLESKYGSIQLDLTVASRTTPSQGHISENEYTSYFNRLLDDRKARNEITIHEDSSVKFHLERGTVSQKLIIADFASNIRRQHLGKAREFQDEQTLKVLQELFVDALVFSRSELSSDKRVRILLSQGDISEAVMEIFTAPNFKKRDRKHYLTQVLERMHYLSYRLIKSQLKQLAAEVLAYTARQENYHQMIAFLTMIQNEFMPQLKQSGHPFEYFQFEVYLQLSDVHLRAGQFSKAGSVLETSLNLVREAESSLENIFTLYRIYEKMAVFYIDSFQFDKATKLMEELRLIYEDLFEWFTTYPLVERYFKQLKSEYYGDVLCMEIYSQLFQSKDYDEIRKLSDIALTQYPNFQGELERHRQYRSRLESKAGDIDQAISWLILSIDFEHDFSQPITNDVLIHFWNKVESQETPMSQEFFMMYYLLVMTRAKEENHPLADILFKAFVSHSLPKRLFPAHTTQDTILVQSKDVAYHPREISYWYLGDYYRLDGKKKASLQYYDGAIAVCQSNHATLTLKLRMVGILAAKMSLESDEQSPQKVLLPIIKHIQSIKEQLSVESPQLSVTTEQLDQWEEELNGMIGDGKNLSEKLWQFALKWRY